MKISIVIPTYNRNDLLEKCLDALVPETQQIFNYEVIVTDDSQTFEAKKLIDEKFQWVQWIEGPHKGPATNRNNGARQACGEWLVFVDDDCIPNANLIKNYTIAINDNPHILAFEGCIKADRHKRHFLEESPVNETGGYFWSCNIMIQKDYFMNQLKGFDENFPYPAMEDVDLRERIKQDDQTILFVKNAFVVHPWRLHNDILNMTKKRCLSYKYLCSKHTQFIEKFSYSQKLKNELRFYIKNVLFKIIPYRGRGIVEYIRAYIINKRWCKDIECEK